MRASIQLLHCIITAAILVAAQDNDTTTPSMSPTSSLDTAPVRACYTNLSEVETLIRRKNPFIEEEYVLCPNTLYQMGDDVIPGFPPISLRSNSLFKCGDDGKSTNNCVIFGGLFHLISSFAEFADDARNAGIVIQGITFDAGSVACAVLIKPGDVTFIDCIFRNHKNTGVIQALYAPEETRRLDDTAKSYVALTRRKHKYSILNDEQLIRNHEATRNDDRTLQVVIGMNVQILTFENCFFLNNSHGPRSDTTEDGIITALANNDIVLKSCVFQNNNFTEPVMGVNGYAVSVQAGHVTISDSCFIDNAFTGDGVVLLGSASNFNESSNYGTMTDDVTCEFAFVGGECVPFSSDVCSTDTITGNAVPSTVPTTVPMNQIILNNATSDSMQTRYRPHLLLLGVPIVLSAILV